jgi:hypothetical protein
VFGAIKQAFDSENLAARVTFVVPESGTVADGVVRFLAYHYCFC